MGETLERIDVEDARQQIAGGEAQALDVRDEEAWRDAHIPGAVTSVEQLDEGKPVVIITDGDLPDDVASALEEKGLEARVLEGGMDSWKDADFTLQPSEDVDESEELDEDSPGTDSAEDQPA